MVTKVKNISWLWVISVLASFGVLINSCSYDKGAELTPSGQCDTAQYTYKANIEAIFQASCALSGCHDAQTGIGGVQLTTYLEVKEKVDAGSISARMLNGVGGYMPPDPPLSGGKLPDSTLAKVQQWINEGACE